METKSLFHILTFICLSWQCFVVVVGENGRFRPHHQQQHHQHHHQHSQNSQNSNTSRQAIRDSFVKDSIVPDAVPTSPEHYLKVVYQTNEVKLGNELTPTQANAEPTVSWLAGAPRCDQNKLYTLLLVDLDAPGFVHWGVMNIPGDDVKSGEKVTGYFAPGPPAGSGLHRYTFLVYQQPGKVTPPNPWPYMGPNFDIAAFAKQYNMVGPYAGNYFKAQAEP